MFTLQRIEVTGLRRWIPFLIQICHSFTKTQDLRVSMDFYSFPPR